MNHWINLFDGFIEINEKDSNTESANHNLEINESTRNHESLDKPFQWPPVNAERDIRNNPEESTHIHKEWLSKEIDETASSTESVNSSFEINESTNSNKSLNKPSRWAVDEQFIESITQQQPFAINFQKEENVTS